MDKTISKTNEDIHAAELKVTQELIGPVAENYFPLVDWQNVISKVLSNLPLLITNNLTCMNYIVAMWKGCHFRNK
jgi:hypothetical protein